MKHYGDITKLNGAELPIVDVICGGSPCQDLSVGKQNREGIKGERSGLYMEQIRIVKEMREHDKRTRGADESVSPRWMLWENVPGALTSGTPSGEHFRIVIEEAAKVANPDATIPRPARWETAGAIVGHNWSIAWAVHDAKWYGVAQRRRRICMLCDFNGQDAPRILFNPQLFRTALDADNVTSNGHIGAAISRYRIKDIIASSVSGNSGQSEEKKAATAKSIVDSVGTTGRGRESAIFFDAYQHHGWRESNTSGTITAECSIGVRGDTPLVVAYGESGYGTFTEGFSTLKRSGGATGNGGETLIVSLQSGKVRRLTCKECERLQGFPDDWTKIGDWVDDKGRKRRTTDRNRYTALGNSIAIPYWEALAGRIRGLYDRQVTIGSLFDGIGGFPLVFERNGAKTVWASEIEPFCIAVTKVRFPEEDDDL